MSALCTMEPTCCRRDADARLAENYVVCPWRKFLGKLSRY
jgi:hypothetical protein